MKKTTLFGMMAAAALTTLPVMAQTQQGEQRGGPQIGAFAQEQVEGRITKVDKEKGTVKIQTEKHGHLEFKLTPEQVQRLNEGDQLRLQIQLQYMPKVPAGEKKGE